MQSQIQTWGLNYPIQQQTCARHCVSLVTNGGRQEVNKQGSVTTSHRWDLQFTILDIP